MDGSLEGVEFMYILKWKHDRVTLLTLTQHVKEFHNIFSDSQSKFYYIISL